MVSSTGTCQLAVQKVFYASVRRAAGEAIFNVSQCSKIHSSMTSNVQLSHSHFSQEWTVLTWLTNVQVTDGGTTATMHNDNA